MLKSWKVRKGDEVFGHTWEGIFPPALDEQVQKLSGQQYIALNRRIFDPPFTPEATFEIASDLLIGGYSEILEWDEEPDQTDEIEPDVNY